MKKSPLMLLIALMSLMRVVSPQPSEAQDNCTCPWERVEGKAAAPRQAKLAALQREMKPAFTFTIGDTGVLGHPELTGAKLPDAASRRKQAEAQHELAKKAGFGANHIGYEAIWVEAKKM